MPSVDPQSEVTLLCWGGHSFALNSHNISFLERLRWTFRLVSISLTDSIADVSHHVAKPTRRSTKDRADPPAVFTGNSLSSKRS